jgi:hypothetical protein
LEANEHTFSQFDFLTNVMPGEKQRCTKIDDVKTSKNDKNEDITLDSFTSLCASVDFATDNRLKDKEFRLVYDDEDDWDEQEQTDSPHGSITNRVGNFRKSIIFAS